MFFATENGIFAGIQSCPRRQPVQHDAALCGGDTVWRPAARTDTVRDFTSVSSFLCDVRAHHEIWFRLVIVWVEEYFCPRGSLKTEKATKKVCT